MADPCIKEHTDGPPPGTKRSKMFFFRNLEPCSAEVSNTLGKSVGIIIFECGCTVTVQKEVLP